MKLLIISLSLFFSTVVNANEIRCGWLSNPTPANMWLIDKDGSWAISFQGGVDFIDDDSVLLAYKAIENERDFVETNGYYGFSCACLTVDTNKEEQLVTKVYQSKQLSLKRCLEDDSIVEDIPIYELQKQIE